MQQHWHILQTKWHHLSTQLPYLPRTLKLVWRAARGWTAVWVLLLLSQSMLPVATVYLTRTLINQLADQTNTLAIWQMLQPVAGLIILLATVLLLTELLRSATTHVRTVQAEHIKDYIANLIQQQSTAVDLAFYDSADYFDHLHRARAEASYRPVQLIENIGIIGQNSLTLLSLLAILATYTIWLPLVLLGSGLPALYALVRHRLQLHQWWQRVTADERRIWYYDHLLTTPDTAAEVRLFNLGPHFRHAYRQLRQRLRQERLQLSQQQTRADMQTSLLGIGVTAVALVWLLQRSNTSLTLGDLALFYQAFGQGQRHLRTLLENVSELYNNTLFLGHLFQFLALEPAIKEPTAPIPFPMQLRDGIRLENVTFQYPGSKRPLLQNFSLTIPAGQTVAIVGTNGAGKSTLLKLLCRLYDPHSGCISLDNIDLRRFSLQQLRQHITVLFQEPVRYNQTAAQNIHLGTIHTSNTVSELQQAARAAGIHEKISQLPNDYETLLGKWFAGSTDLSSGEWQRLALARAFLRRAALIILDEPTSAMDPWAEADWLQRFNQMTVDQTTLIITHRFTTAMHADMIYVLDGGNLVEWGNHDELLAQNGRYAQSWRTQTKSFAPTNDIATAATPAKARHHRPHNS